MSQILCPSMTLLLKQINEITFPVNPWVMQVNQLVNKTDLSIEGFKLQVLPSDYFKLVKGKKYLKVPSFNHPHVILNPCLS